MSAPSAPDGAHYGVSSVKWYCDTTSRYMGSSDTFISGNQYSLYLQISAEAGYCFSADAALYVNGDNGDIDEYYSGVISVNTVGIWTVPDYPVGSLGSDITAINVLGSVTPYAGKTPEDIISTLSVPGGAEYSVLGGNWYYISDEEEFWVMPPQEEFEAGKRYVLIVYVQANEGHCFNASTEVMINGSSDLIDFSATEIEASEVTEGMDYRIQTLPFTVGTPVTEVAVTGYQTPKIGQTVADNIINITVSDNCTVWNVGWTSDTTGDTLGDDDIFEEGAVYYMYFNLDAADGYAFDTDNLPAITINGDTYLLDDTFTRFNDTHLVFFTINVEPTEDTGKEMIYEVELNGFEKPKAGQTFGELKAALTVPEGAHYTLTEVACYSHADDEFMDDDDVYEAGNNYFFSFMFAPDEGYDFDVDAGLPIPYLNGGSDLIYDFMTSFYIDDDGGFLFGFGTVYLEVEAPEINYGDVNNDGKIDGKDLIRLRKYLVGADVEIFPGADVNGDGEINGKDLIRLRKYLLTEDASLLGPQ